jgi:hypothetical protein
VVFNGGSHSALKQIPTYNVDWVDGLGILSQKGVVEALRFGQHLRERYVTDLSVIKTNDTNKKLKIDHCTSTLSQQTAQVVGASVWQRDGEPWPQAWRPMTVQKAENTDILSGRAACIEADVLATTAVFTSPWYSDRNNVDFLRALSSRAGYPRLTDWRQLYDIHDALVSMNETGHQWPSWIEPGSLRTLRSLVDAGAVIAYNDQTVLKLRAGPLLGHILEQINERISCLASPDFVCEQAVVRAFSAGDFTLHALKSALGLSTSQLPNRVSGVAVELWQTASGIQEIRVLHTDGVTAFKAQLVRGCNDLSCSITSFGGLVQSLASLDWDQECGNAPATKALRFTPPTVACNDEVDRSTATKCKDWAEFGFCSRDDGVRYVYCRHTCLCDPRYARQE